MIRDLEDKVALVTGGTRGIGRAISLSLARRGANVAVVYLRNHDAADETCALIEAEGVKAVPLRCNVGDPTHLETAFSSLEETFGRLDVYVSNAATGVIKPFEQLDEKAWRWTMDANARALFLGAQRAAGLMREGGTMVALSSGGANRVLPGYAVVGVSKAAIEALVRYLAIELAGKGIRVNAVSPGVVDTDALRHFPMRDEMLAQARAKTPSGVLATPEDVARTVDFLTAETSAPITGQTIVIDGGASLLA
ncbi:MAG: SDR family oxidoreductase [Actinomycetota bacterium]|nr:SDR family oxidoreductase [Actinomycetota bacterium]